MAVNSESVVQAAGDLDRLVDSGKGVEDSTRRVESAWAKAVSGIAPDTGQIVKELQLMNTRQETAAQLMAQLSQAVGKASGSFNEASTSAQKMAAAGTKVAETTDQAKARLLALAAAPAFGVVFYDAEKQVGAFNKSLYSGTATADQTRLPQAWRTLENRIRTDG